MAADSLSLAQEAFERRAWGEAHANFLAAANERDLDVDDLERQAVAAHLFGREDESREALAAGYREGIRLGQRARAARFAFWLGHSLMFADRMGEASGWFARARQLLDAQDEECVETGYLLVARGIEHLMAGDAEAAAGLFAQARGTAVRFGDPDLHTMAGHGHGRALIRLGRIPEALSILDELMVAITSREVFPILVGEVCCGVLEACHEIFDVRRAREWTGALSRWCEGQPDLAPHRGPCLVYRAEIMQFHGEWTEAMDEARRACEWLSSPASPEGAADAYYRVGELLRLRGDFDAAEEAYRHASRLGCRPEPGLPLLWLARGQREAAAAALERALEEETDLARRAALLAAAACVAIARGDLTSANAAAEGIVVIADSLGSPAVRALATTAQSAVLLAEGNAGQALGPLRSAWHGWQRLDAPYEAARVRVLIGQVYHELGDHESAAMEFDAARWVFQQLGATPDIASLEELEHGGVPPALPGGITPREAEVLALLAGGLTNKEIGVALVISEHTVARHVQNMLARLGCPSRTALAAFAVQHGINRAPGQN